MQVKYRLRTKPDEFCKLNTFLSQIFFRSLGTIPKLKHRIYLNKCPFAFWTLRHGRLFEVRHLLIIHHFQPHIFTRFIFYQQNKEDCSNFIPCHYDLFFLEGMGRGGGGGIRGWVLISFLNFLGHHDGRLFDKHVT